MKEWTLILVLGLLAGFIAGESRVLASKEKLPQAVVWKVCIDGVVYYQDYDKNFAPALLDNGQPKLCEVAK